MPIRERIALYCLRLIAGLFLKFNLPLEAAKYLEIAKELARLDKESYFLLVSAYQTLGKSDEMLNTLKAATKLFPNEIDFLWSLGVRLLFLGEPADALLYLKRYAENFSGDKYKLANINAVIGSCYSDLKQWDDAEKCLRKSKELVPWDLDAFVGLIELYIRTSRTNLVLELLNEYISNCPNLYPLYLWKGHYHQYNLRQPKVSIEYYRQSLERVTDSSIRKFCDSYLYTKDLFDRLLNEYIDALISTGESDKVFSEIKKYEKNRIGSIIESKKRLIDYYIEIENYVEAKKNIEKLSNRLVNTPEILSSQAIIEFKQGNVENALGVIRNALQIEKTSNEALVVLGTIQTGSNLWDEAADTYRMLLKYHPFAANFYSNLGLCYFKMAQYEKARECYETRLNYDPLDADAWIGLADIYVKLENPKIALHSYKNGLQYDWLDSGLRQHALQVVQQLEKN